MLFRSQWLPATVMFVSFMALTSADPITNVGAGAEDTDQNATTPEAAVRRFMAALLERDQDAIERAILPHPNAAELFRMDQQDTAKGAAKRAAERSLKRLKRGDTVFVPGGKPLVLNESHVNDERAQIMADDMPLPFIAVKVQSEWFINAGPMIEGRRAARRQTENVAADRLPWTNNPAALAMLAGETGAGEFSLRPPIGFNLKRSGPPTWGWVGEPHDRNPGPILAITTAELEKKDVAKSLDDGLSDALTGVSNRYVEWQVSDSERGDIAGRPFVRVFWAGVRRLDAPEPVRGQKAHGFVYLTCDNRRATTIVFQDAEPGYRASMLSCQAAVLTYRGAKPQ